MTFARCRFIWAAYVPRCKRRGFDADLSRRSPFCPTFRSPVDSVIRPRHVHQRPQKRKSTSCILPFATLYSPRCALRRGLRPDARSAGEWHDRGYIPPCEESSLLQQPCSSPSSSVNQHRTVPKENRSMLLLSVCLSATRRGRRQTVYEDSSRHLRYRTLRLREGEEARGRRSRRRIRFRDKTHPSIRGAASLVPFP